MHLFVRPELNAEHSEQEHLFQKLVGLAGELGYKFQASRKGDRLAATPTHEQPTTPASAQSSATVAQGTAAKVLVLPGGSADFGTACKYNT